MNNEKDGRFKYGDIHRYLSSGTHPDEHSKPGKQALRKRAKFFRVNAAELYYVGGQTERDEPAYEQDRLTRLKLFFRPPRTAGITGAAM